MPALPPCEDVSLSELLELTAVAVAPPEPRPQRQRGRHRRTRSSSWACLVERVLGGWPMTLRAALLLLILLSGLVVGLLLGLGVDGTAFLTGLSLLLQLVMRGMTKTQSA
jgi:hypothetical protein